MEKVMIDCECTKWQDSNYPINEHHAHCPKHPSHAKEKVYCLVCDKQLDYEPGPHHNGNVMDGGFMLVSFHYGSCHDQCHGFPARKSMRDANPMQGELPPYNNLLTCDEIEAFICDGCFEKKFDKMKGYDIRQTRERTKIV